MLVGVAGVAKWAAECTSMNMASYARRKRFASLYNVAYAPLSHHECGDDIRGSTAACARDCAPPLWLWPQSPALCDGPVRD